MASFTYQSKNRYDILPTEVSQRIMELEKSSDNYHKEIFIKNFTCQNVKFKDDGKVLEFELVGIDAAIANAFRRILISEVPTMAVKTVYFHDNTSIVQDEVLAHRIGLIPLKVDPNLFQNYNDSIDKTDLNTLVYRLDVTCKKKKKNNSYNSSSKRKTKHEVDITFDNNSSSSNNGGDNESLDMDYDTLEHGIVYSSDLKWIKQGSQGERLKGVEPRPVYEDIVIAKLRPGQHISFECHAVRGTGKEHAKFSPVCTAHYRMMPEVKLVKDVYGDKATKLMKYMPGVFELENVGGKVKAVVKYPQNCRMSRNYTRDEVLKESVVVTRRPDHFIFSIESVGQLPPEVLFKRAVQVLISKCDQLIASVKNKSGRS
jgi:DNA-directed RNA polymerases I and III subunit RPAC1